MPASAVPASALNVNDYFSISYNVTFSRSQIFNNNIFYATVTGKATCLNPLPLTFNEAEITGRVIARHQESGAEVTLNPSYMISISPFPNDVGASIESSKQVALRFPAGSPSGFYDIRGELIEARVRATLWFNATAYLPSSQAMGTIGYMLPPPETEEEQPFFGITSTEGKIDNQGIITEAVFAPSVDNKCSVSLEEGVKALDKYGDPLSRIRIYELVNPPPPPDNCLIISPVYDIKPDGAVFEPSAGVTISYENNRVPDGVNHEKLVLVTWDEATSQWIELEDLIVDPLANKISASTRHFSAFAVMAYTAPPVFTIQELDVAPAEVDGGDEVSVSATVVNSGDLSGSYEVILKIDNEVEQSFVVNLDGKSSEVVSFIVLRDIASLYAVNLNGLLGSFVVREEVIEEVETPPSFVISGLSVSPVEVDGGDEVSVSATVVNSGDLSGSYEVILKIDNEVEQSFVVNLDGKSSEVVSFIVLRDIASLYAVNLNGLLGSFVVREEVIEEVETPPSFVISGLSVSPVEVDGGDEVSVSATVVNSGDLSGSYEVILKIDNEVEQSFVVNLDGKSSEVVSFIVLRDIASLYAVNLNGLLGSFVVREEVIEEVDTQDLAASALPPPDNNRWLTGSAYTAGAALLVFIVWFIRRRKKTKTAKEPILIHYDLPLDEEPIE